MRCRESLQRRKPFEKLLPVSSPPLHCTFVSFSSHPLILTFTICNPRCSLRGYSSAEQQEWVGSCFFFVFFFLGYLSCIFLHSGVTLFHSPTQGITLLKGIGVDLVGSCTEMLQTSTVWVTWHAVLLVPKTDRSKDSVSQSILIIVYHTLASVLYCHIHIDGRNVPQYSSDIKCEKNSRHLLSSAVHSYCHKSTHSHSGLLTSYNKHKCLYPIQSSILLHYSDLFVKKYKI